MKHPIKPLLVVLVLAVGNVAVAWDAGILARIKAPSFPDRDFVITRYGAKPGADCTGAIQAAVEACHKAGGGRVVVPAGEWLTGAIRLKSNVNLHVAEDATLRWKFDPDNHPVVFSRWEGVECMNYSPLIYALGETNIAITGQGTLDGGADETTWWDWNKRSDNPRKQKADRDKLFAMAEAGAPVEQRVFGPGHYLRPNFIQPYKCRNILIEGVKIIRSPMWEIHPVLSQNVIVRGVTVISHGPNNDGCDPESCRDVLIEDCVFDTGDDCIAIKSGRNADGRRLNAPTENVIIRNCTMKDGHGGVVLGSECTGGIRNVFVENCAMDSPNLDRALRFKNNAVRGGTLENVFMRNVKIGRVGEAVLTIDLLYEEGAKGAFQPVVRNVLLDNITSTASPRVMFIRGFEGAVIDDIRIRNCAFRGVTEPEVLGYAGTLSLSNVTIEPARPTRSLNTVAAPKTPLIVLVGDSTVTDESGWGLGFKRFLADGVTCTNLARGGRSSKSYLAEGHWEKALALKGDYYLIQFGHNDQPGKGPERETDPATTYAANMARYVDEARAIGATPILVTSLTRRIFSTNDPARIESTLTPYVEAVKKLAAEKHVPLIDLHARSIALCEKLGPAGVEKLNPIKDGKPDRTHLDAAGSEVFARLVVEDLRRVVPALAPVLLAQPRQP
jgi:polygalacturonase/lysophospholipase L1-like esterase